jgi:heme O synthase-like polyprenyltransferase
MLDKFFKKYQWYDKELEKKHKMYNNLTFLVAVIALICLYVLPENVKMILTLIVAAGIVMVFLAWRVQEQDKKIKQAQTQQPK